jgi:hypothetical protein
MTPGPYTRIFTLASRYVSFSHNRSCCELFASRPAGSAFSADQAYVTHQATQASDLFGRGSFLIAPALFSTRLGRPNVRCREASQCGCTDMRKSVLTNYVVIWPKNEPAARECARDQSYVNSDLSRAR